MFCDFSLQQHQTMDVRMDSHLDSCYLALYDSTSHSRIIESVFINVLPLFDLLHHRKEELENQSLEGQFQNFQLSDVNQTTHAFGSYASQRKLTMDDFPLLIGPTTTTFKDAFISKSNILIKIVDCQDKLLHRNKNAL